MLGITWWQFWELNPHIIKCIANGYEEQRKEQDAMMHAWFGTYGLSAVSVAVEHCLSGKKATSKYIEKPILSDDNISAKQDNSGLSEKEKMLKTEQLFAQLSIMGANFNLNKDKKQ